MTHDRTLQLASLKVSLDAEHAAKRPLHECADRVRVVLEEADTLSPACIESLTRVLHLLDIEDKRTGRIEPSLRKARKRS